MPAVRGRPGDGRGREPGRRGVGAEEAQDGRQDRPAAGRLPDPGHGRPDPRTRRPVPRRAVVPRPPGRPAVHPERHPLPVPRGSGPSSPTWPAWSATATGTRGRPRPWSTGSGSPRWPNSWATPRPRWSVPRTATSRTSSATSATPPGRLRPGDVPEDVRGRAGGGPGLDPGRGQERVRVGFLDQDFAPLPAPAEPEVRQPSLRADLVQQAGRQARPVAACLIVNLAIRFAPLS